MQSTAYGQRLPGRRRPACRPSTKILLIMKITIVLMLAGALQVSARGYAQGITLDLKHASLEKALGEIRKQSGYYIIYGKTEIAKAAPVDIHVVNAPLEKVLASIFAGQPLSYRISDRFITIGPRQETRSAAETPADILPGEVRGRVTNEKGEIMPGATVIVKGTRRGTVTNVDGSFVLHNVQPGDVLIVTYTGYASLEIAVQESQLVRHEYIQARIRPSSDPIDEVQIIAYGSTTKRLNLGNVSTVSSQDIDRQPVDNVLTALEGRVPGLQVTSAGNNLPGQAPTVRIRGINSMSAGLSPLYILDGVPIPETQNSVGGVLSAQSMLMSINPADIESVEVLKDADATAIYGSRGANGVILITTKKGSAGKTSVSANAYTGFGKVPHFIDLMDMHQYNAMRREALSNDKLTPNTANAGDLLTWDSTRVTDWQKYWIGGAAPVSDANVSVSGGSVTTRFNANAGYHDEGTTFTGNNTGANRKSIRLSMDHNSADGRIGINVTSGYSINTIDLIGTNLVSNIMMAPDYPLYTPGGQPNWYGVDGYPLAYLMQPFHNVTDNYDGHAAFRYTPLKGLNLRLNAGFNNSVNNQTLEMPASSEAPSNPFSELVISATGNKTWIAEPQAEYSLQVERHHLALLGGATWQQSQLSGTNDIGLNFPNDALIGNIGSASTIIASTTQTTYAYNAFFGRLNYNWDQRYLLDINYRHDGSSRFGPGKRWGDFGSVAAGWMFSKEDFIRKALPWLSYGKLRASYGTNGNDQIADYGYLSTYNNGSLYQTSTLVPSTIANPDYRWELDRKLEIGLELGVLKDRILLNASAYRNRTGNQLIYYTLSPQTGFQGYQANFPGELQNQGIELQLNTKNIVRKDFSWTSTLNFTVGQNKLLTFPNLDQTTYYGTYFVGHSLSVVQAYQFQSLDSTGRPVYVDRNKDGTISSTDRMIMGDNNPLVASLINNLNWKGFTLNFMWEYTHMDALNNVIPQARVGVQGTNALTLEEGRWQKPGDEKSTDIPLFTTLSSKYNARYYSQASIWWMHNNIYRLRNASLYYDLPSRVLKATRLQRIRVYVLGQNLWVSDPIRRYRLDPETGNSAMPPLRTWTFGINCTF